MSPRSLPIIFLATACLLAAGDRAAAATQLSWYSDGVHLGGSGTWDTTSSDWSANGSTFTTWSNSSNNGATFDFGTGSIGAGYVTLAASTTAGNLTFNDTGFTLLGNSTSTLTLTGSATVYVANGSQALIELPLAGAAGMTLSGSGELVLTSTNTYSGATTVSASYLKLAGSNALPSGNLVIDGGVIELAAANFTLGAGSGASQVQFTSNGGGFATAGSNGSTYAVNLGGQATPATVTWNSTYFLPSSGSTSATLVLGSHQATGTINFENPINLGNAARTVQVNQGSGMAAVDAQLSGVLSGSGGLTVTGDGALALTASNTYSGGTTVSGGILLSIQNASALGSGGVTLSGGTLQLAIALSGSAAVSLTANSAINVSGVTAATLGNLAIGFNTLSLTGTATAANTAYGLTLGSGTLSGSPTFNVADNGSGIATLALGALYDGGTARTLTKTGSGLLTLGAAATSLVQGTTVNVSGGTLKSSNSAALGSFARVTIGSGAQFNLGASQQISVLAGSGSVALGGNLLTIGNSDNQSCTFSGLISGSGGLLAKQGSGMLTLSGSDTYSGGTTVDAGTLEAAGTASLPGYATSGKLTAANAAVLAVGAGGSGWTAAEISTLLSSNGTGFASGSIFGIDTSGGSLSYNSNITGKVGLAKLGGNTLVLSGSDTYSGGTTVEAGILDVTQPGAFPAVTKLTVGAGGTFIIGFLYTGEPAVTPSLAASPGTVVAAVPEPSTFALLAVGAIGLLGFAGREWRRPNT